MSAPSGFRLRYPLCTSACLFMGKDSGMARAIGLLQSLQHRVIYGYRADHYRFHSFKQVQGVCESDGTSDLCDIVECRPSYCVCDCFCLHSQTGGSDSSATLYIVSSGMGPPTSKSAGLHPDRPLLTEMFV